MKTDRQLAIQTLNSNYRHLAQLRDVFLHRKNWIFHIRNLLGMSSRQLAHRLNISAAAISQTEAQEKGGAITIKRMQQYAQKLECDFVYALVPKKKINTIIDNQAKKKAVKLLKKSNVMMELEDQGIESKRELNKQLKELVNKIKNDKSLWD
ncbi:MAG: helix-turn-helix domain-containing protein [Bacteriovoracaceae bacterium]|nr:helix-turn-helix domain-containing protein [Bacteriovoracaceae bacterium]